MAAFILEILCRGCKRCVNTCPVQAITMLSHLAVVDPSKCIECEACMESCMHGAITFKQSFDQKGLQLQLNDVEKKLADLKARWPFHSVQPKMVAEREDLEEERDRLLDLLNPA